MFKYAVIISVFVLLELGPFFDFIFFCVSDFPLAAIGFSDLFIFCFLLSWSSVILMP